MIRNLFMILLCAMLFTSCSKDKKADATGTFETTEVVASSEVAGKLISFNVNEGDSLNAGQEVGIIDTVQLYLSKLQLQKQVRSIVSNKPNVNTQIASVNAQIAKQYLEKKRIENLIKSKAAPTKQLDDVNSSINVLEAQLKALQSNLSNNINSLDAQGSATEIQVAQINDKLKKSHITSPLDGVIISKYVEPGEVVAPGQPLFKIADLNNMFLRVYLTFKQLKTLKLGDKVKVSINGGNSKIYDGKITWISPNSEFTPKNIQTTEERENLVYAVKISVKNDGWIKIGMYGDVFLK